MASSVGLAYRHPGVIATRAIFTWCLQDFFYLFFSHTVIAHVSIAGGRVNIEPDPQLVILPRADELDDDEGRLTPAFTCCGRPVGR